MFAHVHGLKLLEYYDIRYIHADELDDLEANPLYAVGQSELYGIYQPIFDLQPSNHDNVISHSVASMLSKEYLFVTNQNLKRELKNIGQKVEDIRFMVLMLK